MNASPIRVGINGFGRIGRVVARQLASNPAFALVAVNELAEDLGNLAYLYNYDSTYGRVVDQVTRLDEAARSFELAGNMVRCFREAKVTDAQWGPLGVDVLVEATGVSANVEGLHVLVSDGSVDRAVVTHCPSVPVDAHLMIGINEASYDPSKHRVVANGICDANAIAHPLAQLDKNFGIKSGFVTTLHPWLAYQNLVDAPTIMQSTPGHFWSDFSLGRSSVGSLIPKNTTVIEALGAVLPDLAPKLDSFSYRVPTAIVASADMTVRLEREINIGQVESSLEELAANSTVVEVNHESLVSLDYLGTTASVVLDMQWLRVRGDTVKLVGWYDNEWGYGARVVDLVKHVGKRQ